MVLTIQLVLNVLLWAMKLTKNFYVYWLRLEHHKDITSEGYVGITTKTPEQRFNIHCNNTKKGLNYNINKAINKYGKENIIVETLCITSPEHARWLELKLRPEAFIGWNIQRGGVGNPVVSDVTRKLSVVKANQTKKDNGLDFSGENHPNWKGGVSEKYQRKSGTFVLKDKGSTLSKRKEYNKTFLSSGGVWPSSRPEVKDQLSKSHKLRFEELGWWVNSQANNHMWLNSAKVMILRDKMALSRPLLSEMLNIPRNSISSLTDKLHGGWNPLEDNRWIKFYEQNKTESDPSVEELKLLFRHS
jgi:hypothetical protein